MEQIAVEYSVSQDRFHKETLKEYIESNIESMRLKQSTDYQLIGICRSDAEAESFIAMLKTVKETAGSFANISAQSLEEPTSRDIKQLDFTEMDCKRINIYEAKSIFEGAEILRLEYSTDGRAPAETGEDRALCDIVLTIGTAAGEIKVIGFSGCPAKYGIERERNCDNAPVLNLFEYIKPSP